ncbi:hypothetical protein GCM10022216_22460 [Sphingobacterium kyonggiense]|uniref:O-antigen ligase-like membrane protein n=2 Tax=Sphingobacterium kyonggiense TaxID=714075 RepID=A0ABP7YVL1_9SPHI
MRVILILLVGLLTSFYYFPIDFRFLPSGLNTKLLLALVGLVVMVYHFINMKRIILSKEVLIASFVALIFSLVGFISTDINNTSDYAYSTYISSMWVWFSASYVIISLIAALHGKVSIKILTNYLIGVCLFQCTTALLIDFVPSFKMFVDRFVDMKINEFLDEVDRLYGIGATLDVAGIRFSVVLIMISFLLSNDSEVKTKNWEIFLYTLSFFLIAGIGNMMSRTTSVGMVISIGYMIYANNVVKNNISVLNIKLWNMILMTLLLIVGIATYFYQTNKDVYELLRFGFEGFFNFVEKGEWRTDSTDKLNKEMWIWPAANDTKTWLIGKGVFSNWFLVKTDVGYCRFIFYSGTIGLSVFIFFFVYLSYALWHKFLEYKPFFFILFVLAMINWIKVSTDLFLVYALFLSMGSPFIYERYYQKPEEECA